MTAPLNTHIHHQLIEMVKEKLLLERITLQDVDVNVRDKKERNALYWAIKRKSTYNANLLITFGSSLMVSKHQHALFHAIECEHHELVVLLIQKGIDINTIDSLGKTPLMYAIESEVFETVRYLIQQGADIYLLDDTLDMAEDYVKRSNSTMIKEYFQHITDVDMLENNCSHKSCVCN